PESRPQRMILKGQASTGIETSPTISFAVARYSSGICSGGTLSRKCASARCPASSLRPATSSQNATNSLSSIRASVPLHLQTGAERRTWTALPNQLHRALIQILERPSITSGSRCPQVVHGFLGDVRPGAGLDRLPGLQVLRRLPAKRHVGRH